MTHTFHSTSLEEGSAARRDYLTTHKIHKRRTFMSPAGFEPAVTGSKRLQTHALDRVATGIASGGNAASKLGVDYSIQVCCL